MKLLQKPIQRKLSAVLGAQVTFERLNISLLGGSLDAHGVTVAGDDPASPVLTVRRVRAEISLASALKGEIAVKSLTIEHPVFSLVRRADGATNFPRPMKEALDIEVDDSEGQEAPESENPAEGEDEGRWRLDVRKVLLVDGEAHFRVQRDGRDGAETAYHASAEKILAELTHRDDAFDLTLLVDNVGRRDRPAEFGTIKVMGKLTDVEDLAKAADGGLTGHVEVGEYLKAKIDCESIRSRVVQFAVNGSADLGRLWLFVPPGVAALRRFQESSARGRVELDARGRYDPTEGLRIQEFTLRAADVALDPGTW